MADELAPFVLMGITLIVGLLLLYAGFDHARNWEEFKRLEMENGSTEEEAWEKWPKGRAE